MKTTALCAILLLLSGCSSDNPASDNQSATLFGRWSRSSQSFSGDIVSSPAQGGSGRTEIDYIFRFIHAVELNQAGDQVTLTYTQTMTGPQFVRVYRLDGSLATRVTNDISSSTDPVTRLYTGTYSGEDTVTLRDPTGLEVAGTFTPTSARLVFENDEKLFLPFARSFYDWSSGQAVSTPLRDYSLAEPFFLEFSR